MHPVDPQRWVEEHGDVLYRYALARLRDPDRSEDAVQETFIAALAARERFAGGSSERTWLVGILRHKIIDQHRRQAREQPLPESGAAGGRELDELFDERGMWRSGRPADWPNPRQAMEDTEFFTVLRQCLERLPGRLADAFTLREMDETKSEDLCQVLGITPTNLWAMLHRARTRLRQCLESNWFSRPEGRT